MAKALSGPQLFEEAKRYLAGGVNSPVRAFKAVGGVPIFVSYGKGSKVYGEDGKERIDYCLSWGAAILGHAHPEVIKEIKNRLNKGLSFGAPTKLETELAKIINEAVPSIETIRLTNSGTEAVMGAIRLARAYTKKDRIIRFEGSYHGHADYLLRCRGVPSDFAKHTLAVPYNDIEPLSEIVERHKAEIAAIIVEPVAANMGVVLPKKDFLNQLRNLSDRYKIVLIFDEVITGFRVSYGGAQGFFKIKPDLTCLGKIIGGGLPIGAFGGRRDIMKLLAPEGPVYQAGTFSGNPVSVTAGIATLRTLKKTDPYDALGALTKKLCDGIESSAARRDVELKMSHVASLFSVFFGKRGLFKKFFHGLLNKGVYFSPSSFETDFLSAAHTGEDVERTLKVVDHTLKNIRG